MMKNWTVYGLVLIHFVVYLVIWSINNYHKQSKTFPKIVWTYWDSNMPDSVTTLINQWKYLNPTWNINVLSKDTLSLYIKSSELPDGFYEGKESPQHSSDMVRVILLHKYGGVWIDGSTIMMKSLDWILKEFNKTNIHYLGYYMPSFTTIKDKPIIENWFIASKPKTRFIGLIKNEMMKAFGRRVEYIENIIEEINTIRPIIIISPPASQAFKVGGMEIIMFASPPSAAKPITPKLTIPALPH